MTVSKNNFFIGNKDEGNPYIGDLEQGIEYDSYEINFSLIEREGNQTLILPSYTAGARRLIRHLPIIKNQAILEIGSGTGISTLEVLLKNPDSFVFGIEISEGMELKVFFNKLQDRIRSPEVTNDTGYVRIMSLHKSKGLTSKVVFIIGCVAGLVPTIKDEQKLVDTNNTLELSRLRAEAKRLFFVAITRPKQILILSSFRDIDFGVAKKLNV